MHDTASEALFDAISSHLSGDTVRMHDIVDIEVVTDHSEVWLIDPHEDELASFEDPPSLEEPSTLRVPLLLVAIGIAAAAAITLCMS